MDPRRPAAAILVLGLLVAPLSCTDDERVFDQSCAVDADCVEVASCCEGCFSVRDGVRLDACEAVCVDDPCATRYGVGADRLEAFCDEGVCRLRRSP